MADEKSKEIELIEMSILNDGKQLSVRFPKSVVETLQIDPIKDIFVFELDKEKLELRGSLEDRKVWEKEYGNKH
jgi:hypothetical protein